MTSFSIGYDERMIQHRVIPLALSLVASLPAQQVASTGPARIHVIGASVSGGFVDGPLFGAKEQGSSVSMSRVLKQWCGDEVKVTTHPQMEMWMLFREPAKTGKKQVKLAKRRKADVVMAVDFLFWFAYGFVWGDPNEHRPARFEQGLALLDELDVPLVVGDVPDMRGASTRMLKPRQIPTAAMTRRLNERLVEWAKQRENVTLVSLSNLVKELKDDGSALPLASGDLRTPPAALLQDDGLHATRLGMALLTFRLQGTLQKLFSKGHGLYGHGWTFEQFVEAAGAEEELESLFGEVRQRVRK